LREIRADAATISSGASQGGPSCSRAGAEAVRQRAVRRYEIDCVTRIGVRRDRRHIATNLLAAGRHVERVVGASNAGPAAR